MRLEHWAKNVLVFVAPVIGLKILAPGVLIQTLLLFLVMSLLASGTYILNDLLDLESDRLHHHKRHRPFAAGVLPVRQGAFAAAGLIGLGLSGSLALPWPCSVILVCYLIGTLSYSGRLKRQPILDVFILAGLFTLRIIAGGFLITEPLSPWLLTFSMLFFFGLATVKRYAELERVVRNGGEAVVSRGYTQRDLPLLLSAGVASGIGAIIIFTIYLVNEQYPQAVYRTPQALWALMPILMIWTLRVWHLTVHGKMTEDPVVFALKDRTSLVLGLFAAGALLVAWS